MDNLNFPQQLAEFPFEGKAKADIAPPLLLWAYDLWDRKRCARKMPTRADLDPVEIPKLLPHMALVEVDKFDLRLRIQLVGTNIVNI